MTLNNKVRKNIINLNPCIHGARIFEIARSSGKSMEDLLDFSVNLNPLGPPDLKSVLSASSKEINNYPDNMYTSFRKAAADFLNVPPQTIVPGNGSSELIRLFTEAVIEPGDRVLIPAPTFSEYAFQCRLFGADIEYVDYREIADIQPDNYKAIFLCNPNNPTGNLLTRKEVLKLAEKCSSSGVFLFIDEAFIELSDPRESIADAASGTDFVIVLRSLTKTFAVPGLRIGFLIASPAFAGFLNNIRLHWNMNSIAAAAGEKLLREDRDYIERSLQFIKKEREWLISKLGAIRGFRPYHSDTNFILVDIREFGLRSAELTERMLSYGIIIRDCASFGLEDHIRVAVRKRNENRRLIEAFSNIINEWGKELAEKEIEKVLVRGVAARSRIDCEYYPCHFTGQDCTFCFCPFYPCNDPRTGGELINRSAGGKVWSCSACRIIHQGNIAEMVLKELMSGREIEQVWILVMEPVL